MSEVNVEIVSFDMVRCPAKLGMASVESEGGLRSMGKARLAPREVGLGGSCELASAASADSNRGFSPGVNND